jgi:hypothetical protein
MARYPGSTPVSSGYKVGIKTSILGKLFAFESTYLLNQDAQLVLDNNAITKVKNYGIKFNGFTFINYPIKTQVHSWMVKSNLDKSLHDRANALIYDNRKIDTERKAIGAYVTRMLNLTKSFNDLCYMCPEQLLDCVNNFKEIDAEKIATNPNVLNFRRINTYCEDIIKERLMLKLILKGK